MCWPYFPVWKTLRFSASYFQKSIHTDSWWLHGKQASILLPMQGLQNPYFGVSGKTQVGDLSWVWAPLLDSEPWELHAHKSYMENWACKDQSGASRLILHCSHRETKVRPWPLPQMLILWGPQEKAESPCLNGGAESLENLLSLHQVLQEDMGVELGNTTSF